MSAAAVAEQVRDQAVLDGEPLLHGRALVLLGAAHLSRNDHPAALAALLEARPLLDDAPVRDRARLAAEHGHLDAAMGDLASGAESLLLALSLFDEVDDREGRVETLNRLGTAFYQHGDLDEAATLWQRTLRLRTELDDAIGTAGAHNNLAKVRTDQGDLDAALAHLDAARRGFEAAGERRGLGMALHNTAVVHLQRGEVDEAVRLLRRSLARYEEVGHVHGACEARARLATALLELTDDDTEPRELLERAGHDADQLGLTQERARVAEAMADLLERRGDHRGALASLRHLRELERELHDTGSEHRLRALQVRFQLRQLEQDSVTDALTGLTNRRGLDHALTEHLDEQRRSRMPLSLMLLDLDDFKAVNDRFSHRTGDEVLRTVAALLRTATRPTDTCARYGGEEFVVLLPGCALDAAAAIAEDLRRAVRRRPWSQVATDLAVTTSIGVAELAPDGDATTLLASADRALYAAKHAGKDRVEVATPHAPPGGDRHPSA